MLEGCIPWPPELAARYRARGYWRDEPLGAIVERAAREFGEREALSSGDRRISYRELDERSNRVAQALREAGVGRQDHVAFLDMNGPEYFEVLFGCVKIGAINVGINWRLAPGEIAYTINDAEAKALASRLVKQPAGAVSATKRLMRNPELLMAQIKAESERFAERLKTVEAREAFVAFAERRPPDFLKLAKQPA